jgi:hypothetical protein
MTMKDEMIETRTQKIWLGEDGILYTKVLPGAELTLVEAQRITEAEFKLAGGQKRPMLVDIRQVKSITREAREHFAGESVRRFVSAVALCIQSPLSQVIGNFFMGYNKPLFPTKLFTSEGEAIDWLRGFME